MHTDRVWHRIHYADNQAHAPLTVSGDEQPLGGRQSAAFLARDGFIRTASSSQQFFAQIAEMLAKRVLPSVASTSRVVRATAWGGWVLGTVVGGIAGTAVGVGIGLNPRPERAYNATLAGSYAPRCRDATNGDIYNDDKPGAIRIKCFALSLGNPFVNCVNMAMTIGNHLEQSASHVWAGDISAAACGIGAAMLTPLVWLGLQGAATLGVVAPLQGRRFYAALEAHMYFRLAPCFEPLDPNCPGLQPHLFGGMQVDGDTW